MTNPVDNPVVLCIDDDPNVLHVLHLLLEGNGYRFVGASSAEDGLRQLRHIQPDIVLVDLMMEEIDSGVSFTRSLKAAGCTAPVYLLSGTDEAFEDNASYSDLGLSGVFQKPANAVQIVKVLKRIVPPAGRVAAT